MVVREVSLDTWNDCTTRTADVMDLAVCGDKVFECGQYLFLLEGVGKLNNVAVFCREGNGKPLECLRSVADFFRYLLDNKIADSVFIVGGRHHKTYDLLYRFFDEGDVIKENVGYFVSLIGTKWRKFCTK